MPSCDARFEVHCPRQCGCLRPPLIFTCCFSMLKYCRLRMLQSGTSMRCNISGFGLMITCMTRITSTVLWTMLDLETLERMQVYLFHWSLLAAFVGRLVVSQSSTIQASSWSSRTAFLTNFIVSIPSIMPYYTHHSRPFPTHKSRTTMVCHVPSVPISIQIHFQLSLKTLNLENAKSS